jgi:hypothetical protein
MIDVILAVRNDAVAEAGLNRALASLALVSAIDPQLITAVVVVATDPSSLRPLQAHYPQLRVRCYTDQVSAGVYAAFEQGLGHAGAPYCLFLGADDLLLPALVGVGPLLKQQTVDVVVADVLHERRGLVRQGIGPQALVLGNWCQQAVIYRRACLQALEQPFDLRYRIQADHALHLQLLGSPSLQIARYEHPICLFGAGGLSSRQIDPVFKAEMHMLVRRHLGWRWSLVSRLRGLAGTLLRAIRR